MRIVRDGAGFSLVGVVQVVVDSGVYIALTTLGLATPPSNVCGRIAGALLGFWLNGRLTFAHQEQAATALRLLRYLILWIVLTTISTLALTMIGIARRLAPDMVGETADRNRARHDQFPDLPALGLSATESGR